ncbi:pao retrotransposon peptidase domain-containing protein [Phthorimaea operculella]|nr:pao retrotransposon peptidase domain-containing protein [Phthorimaea operculella]
MVDFTNSLIDMSYISVPRNINVPESIKMELVGYADASNIAHGCCLYLRVISPDGDVTVNLLCSKSRINPKDKSLTVPRLELNSAVLLAMLARRVQNTLTLKYDNVKTFLYLDSKIVLAWLNIEPVIAGKDNLVRALDVKVANGSIIRTSVMKICPLPIDYS